ncbi:hypothetical protein [Rhodanobacter geophilus]|uniref:Polysaccharide biosynthesis protein n=1 Tax=Rhodanobacter geophilus TaxID=3162488 RepID=A0ABV3QPI3_9GAMM
MSNKHAWTYPMRSSFYLLLAIAAANVAALIIQLLLPRLLNPVQYTEFAVALGYAQLIASLSFDWLRTSVIRFTGEGATSGESTKLLRAAYGLVSVALLAIVLILVIGSWWRSAFMLAATTLQYAVLQGRLDGELAYHRAQFSNGSYARLGLSRGGLLVTCALLAAVTFRTAVGVMAGMSLALWLAATIVARRFHDALQFRRKEFTGLSARAKELASYGAFTAASSVFTFAFPAVARTAVARTLAPTDSAAFIFALDLALKVFAIAGLAINVLFLQISVRAYDQADGEGGREGVLKTHLVTVASLIFPAVGMACGARELAALLVPVSLVDGFSRCYVWAVIGAGLLAFRQFGVDPAFFVAKQPKRSCVAPISTFVAFMLLVAVLNLVGSWSVESVAGIVVLSVLVSCLVAKLMVRHISTRLVAWGPMLRILICSTCAYGLTLLAMTSGFSTAGKFLLLCMIGGVSYVAVFVLADVPILRKKWVTV